MALASGAGCSSDSGGSGGTGGTGGTIVEGGVGGSGATGGTGATGATGGSGATGGTGATGGSGGSGGVALPAGCVTDPSFITECNPVTNEGCTGSGVACDFSDTGMTCYTDGNTAQPGQPCDTSQGEYCIPTYRCDDFTQQQPIGTCRKYCCASTDCMAGETCTPFEPALGTLGVCDGAGGTGGTGGTDGGAGAAGSAGAPPVDAAAG